ncbi:MAG: HlyD family type I secretion periplasmic adaptor subunit [Pseudomonadota bacterium]
MAERTRRTWSFWPPFLIGFGSLAALAAIVVLWGTRTEIAGAVIGDGRVMTAVSRTAVQHPDGGVVYAIAARNGDKVDAGDLLVQLDDADKRVRLAIVDGQLRELFANEARLEAILANAPELILSPLAVTLLGPDYPHSTLVQRHQTQLDAHYDHLQVQSRLYDEQIRQVRKQIAGTRAEMAAHQARRLLVEEELVNSKTLIERNLLKSSVYFTQKKEMTNIAGTLGRLQARVAELSGRIAEFENKRHLLLPAKQEKASEALNRLQNNRSRYIEEYRGLLAELDSLQIRAPISGVVHESQVLGVRSVVQKAKPVMFIVSDDSPLSVEVQVRADDIDQVYPGQDAQLRFSAFSRRQTPLIYGRVQGVSPDALLDAKTRKPYYNVWVSLPPAAQDELADLELVPGMPVRAFISTEKQTPLSYVMRPLWYFIEKSFRDA